MPEEVAFATKPRLGLTLLQRALAAGVPFAWVAGGSVHGADHRPRRLIERHGRGHVLAVTGAQRLGLKPVAAPPVPPGTGPCRDGAGACCAGWLEDVPAKGWRRLSAGEGAKGPRLHGWAYLPHRSPVAEGWKTGLLIRRSRGRASWPSIWPWRRLRPAWRHGCG